jgi:hypothetical protein
MLASWLIAAGNDPRTEAAWKIFWTIVVLIVVVIIVGGLIMFLTRWIKRSNAAAKTFGDDRTSFKVLYERGELTEEEYQKIRARLGQKLREDLKLPAPPSTDAKSPEASNRLSTAEPGPTIGPAEEGKPGDSDPSIKPA